MTTQQIINKYYYLRRKNQPLKVSKTVREMENSNEKKYYRMLLRALAREHETEVARKAQK